MLVAVAHALEQAMHAKRLEPTRELEVGQLRQMRAQVLAAKPADVELAEGTGEVQAAIGAPDVVLGFGQGLQIGLAGAGLGQIADKSPLALVGGGE